MNEPIPEDSAHQIENKSYTATQLQAPKAAADVMGSLMRGAATPHAAQELLKALGVWAPHEHLAPLRAGLTNDFGSKLQVCLLTSSDTMCQALLNTFACSASA